MIKVSTQIKNNYSEFIMEETTIIDYIGDKKSCFIPAEIKEIHEMAFNNCDNLQNIVVDENNKYFSADKGVLFNKDKTSLIRYPKGKAVQCYTIPDTVKFICSYAFYECENLTQVIFPQKLERIGTRAFHCGKLEEVILSKNVNFIGEEAFYLSKNLKKVDIAESNIMHIDKAVFYACDNLQEVNLPQSIESIGSFAFHTCVNLSRINIPDKTTSIGSCAFANCTILNEIKIPDNISYIGNNAFYNCKNLRFDYSQNLSNKIKQQLDKEYSKNNCQ